MIIDRHQPTEASLLADERARAAAALRQAIERLPSASRQALDPVRWFRRYPVATGAIAVLGVVVVAGQLKAGRQPHPAASRSWLQAVSRDLLSAARRALTSALTARLVWPGIASGDGGSPAAIPTPRTAAFNPSDS